MGATSSPSQCSWWPRVLQDQFPSKEEKSYPGWVWAICTLLSSFPALWVPGVILAQLITLRRRKQDTQQDTQQDTHLKLRDSGVC